MHLAPRLVAQQDVVGRQRVRDAQELVPRGLRLAVRRGVHDAQERLPAVALRMPRVVARRGIVCRLDVHDVQERLRAAVLRVPRIVARRGVHDAQEWLRAVALREAMGRCSASRPRRTGTAASGGTPRTADFCSAR
ncbi:hypothetical protein QAD02_009565 [Eretmocerus hayati]|uniref:Uncharacterized protein n=1 Tax=Eretmocerus hayati TaxID=131215 RepID=A0ACC2NC07_9HYME|nr:hypothetical protein QAD02_009565 [Eretmocerus hayati]